MLNKAESKINRAVPGFAGELAKRGIELIEGLMWEEALHGFREFAATGAVVYNGRQGEG